MTNRVLRLVWVTIFSKIQTSDGHYSCIKSLENNTITGHYFSTKLSSMIEIPYKSKDGGNFLMISKAKLSQSKGLSIWKV